MQKTKELTVAEAARKLGIRIDYLTLLLRSGKIGARNGMADGSSPPLRWKPAWRAASRSKQHERSAARLHGRRCCFPAARKQAHGLSAQKIGVVKSYLHRARGENPGGLTRAISRVGQEDSNRKGNER